MVDSSNNNNTNASAIITAITTILPHPMCALLNLPSEYLECITSSNDEETHCLSCPWSSTFWTTGEGSDDYSARGHVALLVICGFTSVIAIWGFLMTCLILAVLRRRRSDRAFDTLLATLAWVDMTCCVVYPMFAASVTCWLQNWSRSIVPLICFYFSVNATLTAKWSTSLLTLVITLERYVAIVFPFKARKWLTRSKTRGLVICIIGATCLCGSAHYSCTYIGRNRIDRGINITRELDYLLYQTTPSIQYFVTPFDLFDIFVPVPVLIVVNGMLYYKIRKLSSEIADLSASQRKELNAGKMIIPVVAVLIVCTLMPIASMLSFLGKAPTEVTIFGFSFCVLNSAVNFPLYYWTSESFRVEAKAVLGRWLRWWMCQQECDKVDNMILQGQLNGHRRMSRVSSSFNPP